MARIDNKERHLLGISGGRDSAALAIFMTQQYPALDIEYFFTDTGKELPEVYEFLGRLEGFLGKPIQRLNPDRDFDFWLAQYKHFLPSPQTRWCTRMLKIRPFEAWIRPDLERGVRITSYIAIRADENHREGHSSTHVNLTVRLPFREHGINLDGVRELLEASGVGFPSYYRWRSRSGCTFCFFQQKIEWVRLRQEHPNAFEEAKQYEKLARDHASPFTWSAGESLEELERPERIKQIQERHALRVARLRFSRRMNTLDVSQEPDLDDVYDNAKGCLACHK
jgi:3'-phosphoadenosine 5'-phosphosulfate sulfotransferase (PAPS reductase)/FAD synthetase